MCGAPRIQGRPGHDKAIFLAPTGITLTAKKLPWENKNDSTKTHTVFEFRGGLVQDVLPPSIHPDTKKPYEWKIQPDTIPELPREFLSIWEEWDKFRSQLINICPWAKTKISPPQPKKVQRAASEDNIIQKFNDANRVTDILEQHGYIRVSQNRYLSPYSTTNLAGVHVFPNDNRIFSHHGSEPFDSSKSHDAFDMFCHFEHGGNIKDALIAAAKQLGIKTTFEKQIEHGADVAASFIAANKKSSDQTLKEKIKEMRKATKLSDNYPPFPEITHPLFKKWMDIGSRLMYSHPSYHFGNLLPIASLALGKRVSVLISTKYVYTNFYTMLVGTSTISGKSFSSDTAIDEFGIAVASIPTLLNPTDNSLLKRKSWSNPRLVQDMSKSHNALWYYDEAKEFFDESGDRGWNAPIIGNLCTAYDGSSLEISRSNKSSKPNEPDNKWVCEHPFLNLLFNMTISQLQEASTQKIVGSGFFYRWLWFLENGGEKKKNVTASEEDLEGIAEIKNELRRVGTQLKKLQPNDICFCVNETIEDWSMEISKRSDDEKYQAATGRSVIHVYKIAMVFSLFDPEFQKVVLNQPEYPIRCELPERWVKEAISIVEQYLLPRVMAVVDYSETVDKTNRQIHVLHCLRDGFGGVASHSELLKRTKIDRVDFLKAIATLKDSEEIVAIADGKKSIYRLNTENRL